MEQTAYGLRVTVPMAYEAAVERAVEALKAEGFGVLTTIDVQQTLRAKLNRPFRKFAMQRPAGRALFVGIFGGRVRFPRIVPPHGGSMRKANRTLQHETCREYRVR